MYDIYLVRGFGLESMLGILPFEFEKMAESSFEGQGFTPAKKQPIPPFESEITKQKEKKKSTDREGWWKSLRKLAVCFSLGIAAIGLAAMFCGLLLTR